MSAFYRRLYVPFHNSPDLPCGWGGDGGMIPVWHGRLPTAERHITRFHEAMHLKRIDLVGRGIMRRPTVVSHGRAGGAR